MRAVQDGPTTIVISWTPSSDATGYRIYYTGTGGHNGTSENLSGGSHNSHSIASLQNGQTYTVSLVATSHGTPSTAVVIDIALSEMDNK